MPAPETPKESGPRRNTREALEAFLSDVYRLNHDRWGAGLETCPRTAEAGLKSCTTRAVSRAVPIHRIHAIAASLPSSGIPHRSTVSRHALPDSRPG